MKKFLLSFSLVAVVLTGKTLAQDSSSFSVSGYVDAYAAIYQDSLPPGEYQQFPSVSPRSHQFGLNVAQLSAKYSGNRIRGTVTLHYGDIPLSTWSPTFNFIQEANVGVRLCKKAWLDAGFFRTHIGTEGLFPKENITSSVAVPTFFEPYYQAGLRLNYTPTEKLALNFYLLNGYNLFEDNNKKKSAGLLATYTINSNLSVGYDNYVGDDTPQGDTTNHLRFYNNAFLNFEKGKIKIVTGVDVCLHQHPDISAFDSSENSGLMVSGVFILRYMISSMFNVYGRFEFYNDPDGVVSGVMFDSKQHPTGLKLWGETAGAEWKPTTNSYLRLEVRALVADSDQEIFYWDKEFRNTRLEAMINLGVWFP